MAAEQTGLNTLGMEEARRARFGWVQPTVYAVLTVAALVWALGGIEITWERVARGGPQIVSWIRGMFGV